jgi:MOSC domain-containing protein YiiM
MASVLAVCISQRKGTPKHPVEEIQVKQRLGIQGDAHAGDWHRQISLLGRESVDKVRPLLPDIQPGAFAENILTEGITLHALPVGTLLQIGEAELEITQIGKACHQGCAIRRLTGDCVMPREGVFAIVKKEGVIRPGDAVEILP